MRRGGPRRNRPSLIHVIRVTRIEKFTEPVPLQARLAGLLLLPTINVPCDPSIMVELIKVGGHSVGSRTPDIEKLYVTGVVPFCLSLAVNQYEIIASSLFGVFLRISNVPS